jgi:hypothetical protein
MRFDNLSYSRQAEARAVLLGAEEDVEQSPTNGLGHPRPVIDHLQDGSAIAGKRLDFELTALWHCLLSIAGEVHERDPQEIRIDFHRRQTRGQVRADLDLMPFRFRLKEFDKLGDKRAQVPFLQVWLPCSRELKKRPELIVQPPAFAANGFELAGDPLMPRIIAELQVFPEQLQVHPNRRQRIPQLMRQPTGQRGDLSVLPPKPFRRLVRIPHGLVQVAFGHGV